MKFAQNNNPPFFWNKRVYSFIWHLRVYGTYCLVGMIENNSFLIFRMQDLKASLLDESTQMSAPGGAETEGMVMDETSQQASQSSVTKTNKSTYEMSNLDLIKGQLISKCLFSVIDSSKIATKIL